MKISGISVLFSSIAGCLGSVLVPSGLSGQTRDLTPPPAVESAIRHSLDEIKSAAESLDANRVFSYVLENDRGALIQGGRLFETREEALESTQRGFQGLTKVSYAFDREEISLLSPTVALAVGSGTSTAVTEDGRTFTSKFLQSVVLMLVDGEWKVVHSHRSILPAE